MTHALLSRSPGCARRIPAAPAIPYHRQSLPTRHRFADPTPFPAPFDPILHPTELAKLVQVALHFSRVSGMIQVSIGNFFKTPPDDPVMRFAMIPSPIRSLALTALAGTFAFSAAPAADPATLRSPAISDVVLARSALAALDADPVLREVNLLVSVVDRVAVVGGPVASADRGKRAESIVRRVPGIVEVKNRCFVQESPDPLLRAMSDRYPATARRVQTSDLPGVVASPKTGVVDEFAPALGENNLAMVEPAEKSVVARRPMNPGDSVLLPPVGLRPPPAGSTVLPTPAGSTVPPTPAGSTVPLTPAVLTGASSNALAAAEVARKADRRFAGLTLSFANGTLVIAGSAARVADAWDLAQELRRLPGVPRVALGAVEVK